MEGLAYYQYVLIGLIFIWSGFVRSGLGFGGAVLALPFLLLVKDDPLVFLPIIGVHLLFFSVLITWKSNKSQPDSSFFGSSSIDWSYLKYSLKVMIIPKLIGVFGLLTLPATLMSSIIYVIVIAYAISYVLNKPLKSNSKTLDTLFLILGGYISGTSLIGAPLIVAVFVSNVAKHKLRDTLFILWAILVLIKLASFVIAGVDLQLIHHLWLLPLGYIGHVIGEKAHQKMLAAETPVFFRILGSVLIVVSMMGLVKAVI
ncbi:TSUP family transporter [Aliamphritea hakodatensis]|uniref:TSUP family transporter n=1 Tax=Aliamphritea hakodatensis TaxID=2895352 RepID=UPI0022FD8920|nr:TSUP family transporter [Aliamphritea hakodatensis]